MSWQLWAWSPSSCPYWRLTPGCNAATPSLRPRRPWRRGQPPRASALSPRAHKGAASHRLAAAGPASARPACKGLARHGDVSWRFVASLPTQPNRIGPGTPKPQERSPRGWPKCVNSSPSAATRMASLAWPSRRTARPSPAPPGTRRCACGRWPAARSSSPCAATRTASLASPSRRTAGPSPAPQRTRRCACGRWPAARSCSHSRSRGGGQ